MTTLLDAANAQGQTTPFTFTFHISDLFSKSLASFLKYAHDAAIGHPFKNSHGICIINDAFKYVSKWSGENGLSLSPPKCVQCMFFLKDKTVTNLGLKATMNANALSTVESVTGIGVTFSSNAKESL